MALISIKTTWYLWEAGWTTDKPTRVVAEVYEHQHQQSEWSEETWTWHLVSETDDTATLQSLYERFGKRG
jgi:hypothetical protein